MSVSITLESKRRPKYLLDAKDYYRFSINPKENFDRVEITLSHLFREPSPVLGGHTYGSSLFNFLDSKGAIRESIIEIGGGLGDTMRELLLAGHASVIKRCEMFDLSPALSECQKFALSEIKDVEIRFSSGNCEKINQFYDKIDGLLICNGVIADLATCLVEDGDDIQKISRGNKIIENFIRGERQRKPYYMHFGALEFIQSLYACLSNNGVAMISEYTATDHNQPSWFDNHYECGIDFGQIKRFADYLGFDVEEFDVADVIGLDTSTEFLSMDFFTMRDAMAVQCPSSMRLWQLSDGFPVRAYTRDSIKSIISSEYGSELTDQIMSQVNEYFFPIDEIGFDSKNPTTWHYKYLLLKKSEQREQTIFSEFLKDVFADDMNFPEESAEYLTKTFSEQRKMTNFDPAAISLLQDLFANFTVGLFVHASIAGAQLTYRHVFNWIETLRNRRDRGDLLLSPILSHAEKLQSILDELKREFDAMEAASASSDPTFSKDELKELIAVTEALLHRHSTGRE